MIYLEYFKLLYQNIIISSLILSPGYYDRNRELELSYLNNVSKYHDYENE